MLSGDSCAIIYDDTYKMYGYSSRAYWNISEDITRKMASKAAIISSHDHRDDHDEPSITIAVPFTAAINTGTTTGKKRSGSMNSLALVLTATAENIVPTATKPIVARKAISMSPGMKMGRLRKIEKIGMIIISMTNMKIKMASILPK